MPAGSGYPCTMSARAEVSATAGVVPREDDHDPFEVLRNANTVLLHNLRRDEVSPELQKQLTTTGMASSSQAYFCDPYTNSYLGPQVRSGCYRFSPPLPLQSTAAQSHKGILKFDATPQTQPTGS